MLTPDQRKWIDHLSEACTVTVVPFDPSCSEKINLVRQKIKQALGFDLPIEHHGASSLGISGQDEIDVYLPVSPAVFDENVIMMTKVFGAPKSVYPLERARFSSEVNSKHIDVFVVNNEHPNWINSLLFEDYLRKHPDALDEYRKLKEDAAGQTVREYYRRKIEFINDILTRN